LPSSSVENVSVAPVSDSADERERLWLVEPHPAAASAAVSAQAINSLMVTSRSRPASEVPRHHPIGHKLMHVRSRWFAKS
jgi:hypothetical protein